MNRSQSTGRLDRKARDKTGIWVMAGTRLPAGRMQGLPMGKGLCADANLMNESACLAFGGIRNLPGSDSPDMPPPRTGASGGKRDERLIRALSLACIAFLIVFLFSAPDAAAEQESVDVIIQTEVMDSGLEPVGVAFEAKRRWFIDGDLVMAGGSVIASMIIAYAVLRRKV